MTSWWGGLGMTRRGLWPWRDGRDRPSVFRAIEAVFWANGLVEIKSSIGVDIPILSSYILPLPPATRRGVGSGGKCWVCFVFFCHRVEIVGIFTPVIGCGPVFGRLENRLRAVANFSAVDGRAVFIRFQPAQIV